MRSVVKSARLDASEPRLRKSEATTKAGRRSPSSSPSPTTSPQTRGGRTPARQSVPSTRRSPSSPPKSSASPVRRRSSDQETSVRNPTGRRTHLAQHCEAPVQGVGAVAGAGVGSNLAQPPPAVQTSQAEAAGGVPRASMVVRRRCPGQPGQADSGAGPAPASPVQQTSSTMQEELPASAAGRAFKHTAASAAKQTSSQGQRRLGGSTGGERCGPREHSGEGSNDRQTGSTASGPLGNRPRTPGKRPVTGQRSATQRSATQITPSPHGASAVTTGPKIMRTTTATSPARRRSSQAVPETKLHAEARADQSDLRADGSQRLPHAAPAVQNPPGSAWPGSTGGRGVDAPEASQVPDAAPSISAMSAPAASSKAPSQKPNIPRLDLPLPIQLPSSNSQLLDEPLTTPNAAMESMSDPTLAQASQGNIDDAEVASESIQEKCVPSVSLESPTGVPEAQTSCEGPGVILEAAQALRREAKELTQAIKVWAQLSGEEGDGASPQGRLIRQFGDLQGVSFTEAARALQSETKRLEERLKSPSASPTAAASDGVRRITAELDRLRSVTPWVDGTLASPRRSVAQGQAPGAAEAAAGPPPFAGRSPSASSREAPGLRTRASSSSGSPAPFFRAVLTTPCGHQVETTNIMLDGCEATPGGTLRHSPGEGLHELLGSWKAAVIAAAPPCAPRRHSLMAPSGSMDHPLLGGLATPTPPRGGPCTSPFPVTPGALSYSASCSVTPGLCLGGRCSGCRTGGYASPMAGKCTPSFDISSRPQSAASLSTPTQRTVGASVSQSPSPVHGTGLSWLRAASRGRAWHESPGASPCCRGGASTASAQVLLGSMRGTGCGAITSHRLVSSTSVCSLEVSTPPIPCPVPVGPTLSRSASPVGVSARSVSPAAVPVVPQVIASIVPQVIPQVVQADLRYGRDPPAGRRSCGEVELMASAARAAAVAAMVTQPRSVSPTPWPRPLSRIRAVQGASSQLRPGTTTPSRTPVVVASQRGTAGIRR